VRIKKANVGHEKCDNSLVRIESLNSISLKQISKAKIYFLCSRTLSKIVIKLNFSINLAISLENHPLNHKGDKKVYIEKQNKYFRN
jgi:hypothetical protein